MKGKELKKLLEENGWQHDRTAGSHHIMVKQGCRPIPVPIHGGVDIGPDLLKRVLKKQDLDKAIV